MKTNFNKIVLVPLCDNFSRKIGKTLSQSLGMMFCDAKDLVEYELIDKDMLKQISSKQYMDQAEKKVMKHLASFENVVASISFDYLIHNINILKAGGMIVFLQLSKKYISEEEKGINMIA